MDIYLNYQHKNTAQVVKSHPTRDYRNENTPKLPVNYFEQFILHIDTNDMES